MIFTTNKKPEDLNKLYESLIKQLPNIIFQIRVNSQKHISVDFLSKPIEFLDEFSINDFLEDSYRLSNYKIYEPDLKGFLDSYEKAVTSKKKWEIDFRLLLPESGYKWIRCADEVPCGSVAKIVLKDQGIVKSPVSLEPMASSVLAKLLVGEVDAAIIYKSDAFANSMKINFIEFSNTKAASTFYQIAKLEDGFATTKVLNFLKSKETIKYLVRNGFETK